jgi:hypothetical protein
MWHFIHYVIIHARRKLKYTLRAASSRIVYYFGGSSLTLTQWDEKVCSRELKMYEQTQTNSIMLYTTPRTSDESMWFYYHNAAVFSKLASVGTSHERWME